MIDESPESGRAPDGGPLNPPPPAPDADRLIELAAQLTRLRRQADTNAELVAALRRDTEGHFETVGVTLRDHADAIRGIVDRQERVPAVRPVPWHLLTVDEAAREWERLARWIDEVFVPWGEITRDQLPDCWALHRPMLTQLSWLHVTHVHVYRPDSDPGLAADWHMRWAPAVLLKVRAARNNEMCRPGEHMVDQTESNRRRAEVFDPTLRGGGEGLAPLGTDQLATREVWQAFYLDARRADLEWRAAQPDLNPAPEDPS